jgi:hypothetical protein
MGHVSLHWVASMVLVHWLPATAHWCMQLDVCCAVLWCLSVQVGDPLDIEILRGNSKEHVTAVLEPNA